MKRSLTWLAGFLFLIAVPCFGAETGTVTLLFGQPKLLRGTTWFNLKEGVRLRDGDVIDLPASGAVAARIHRRRRRQRHRARRALHRCRLGARRQAARLGGIPAHPRLAEIRRPSRRAPRLRVRTALGTIAASDAAAVVHAGDGFEVFVETGTAKLSDVGKLELTGGEIKAGGFASRSPASR